jgi:hypothetical protein
MALVYDLLTIHRIHTVLNLRNLIASEFSFLHGTL